MTPPRVALARPAYACWITTPVTAIPPYGDIRLPVRWERWCPVRGLHWSPCRWAPLNPRSRAPWQLRRCDYSKEGLSRNCARVAWLNRQELRSAVGIGPISQQYSSPLAIDLCGRNHL